MGLENSGEGLHGFFYDGSRQAKKFKMVTKLSNSQRNSVAENFECLKTYVHYSQIYEYVYIETPKTGCSTIKHTLANLERQQCARVRNTKPVEFGYSAFHHSVHNRELSPLAYPGDPDDLIIWLRSARSTFCFIRNPFTRVLSTYIDKFATNLQRRKLFLKALRQPHSEAISFCDFLKKVEQQKPNEMDGHWNIQSQHLLWPTIRYSFVGRFECFMNDFESLLDQISPVAKSFYSTVDEHKTHLESQFPQYYADGHCIDLVRRIYAKDFKSLHYSANPDFAFSPPRKKYFIGVG